ncbi:hypothetical protein K435DRAFT_795398 [Dendrothele bispora CBS 962.96]|uniref:C2H2-type domain-containing protein n=1 Tax=Dendrothele bispora (strain CBS 962.96) TaxID=1314807 RepID=A0A4V4HGH1_DENBC|nr:hypothetical protein K435DRAFT_795398 [Dendrothele bispora CBS 962.96]
MSTVSSGYLCNGCSSVFGRQSDLNQHHLRTSSRACQEAAQDAIARIRASRLPQRPKGQSSKGRQRKKHNTQSRSRSPLSSEEPEEVHPPFMGDFFGADYTPEDFPGFEGSGVDLEVEEEPSDEAALEDTWEPPRHPVQTPNDVMDTDIPPPPTRHENPLLRCLPADRDGINIETFGGRAGEAISGSTPQVFHNPKLGFEAYQSGIAGSSENIWAPFASRIDWEVARWAKMRGTGSTAFSDLLSIQGVAEALDLSYRNTNELNNIIDQDLPSRRPTFSRQEVVIGGKAFDFYNRNPLDCIRALYGNPDHAQYLCFSPERHYADPDKTMRLYHDFNTGKWWWDTQKALEHDKPGATIIPVIISSDKTQVTLFRNKSAYPVYLTIGNLPKEIRSKPSQQGQVLLVYLPTDRLEHIKNKSSRRRTVTNLFHACMRDLLAPLKKAGLEGIELKSGDGVVRRCHPILAVYVGDYPEQVLVTTGYYGDCASCECPKDELGIYPCPHPYRNFQAACDAADKLGADDWVTSCHNINVKPVQHPFWQDLPYTDIFRSITPDILHQLYQGVMKHLIAWLTDICGANEIDARSNLLLSATRALLDFLYLSCYPIHSDESLVLLEQSLATFHTNRNIFVILGAREHFNLPKLHFLSHYCRAVKLYGTTDNYNTETTERLHIDFAKDAYRASNRKDEYTQMTRWLERREKIVCHTKYIAWRLGEDDRLDTSDDEEEDVGLDLGLLPQGSVVSLKLGQRYDFPGARRTLADLKCVYSQNLTRFPTVKFVRISKLQDVGERGYRAVDFTMALKRFVVQFREPTLPMNQVDDYACFVVLPFRSLPVWHKVKFVNFELFGKKTLDSICAHPRRYTKEGKVSHMSRFDTALIKVKSYPGEDSNFLKECRVGRVRVIFSLPPERLDTLFAPNSMPPRHLAYVEWFTKFDDHADLYSGLHAVKRSQNVTSTIVPLETLQRSVHLIPKWNGVVPSEWTSKSVLDDCNAFFLNVFKDDHTYFNLT